MTHTPTRPIELNQLQAEGAVRESDGSVTLMVRRFKYGHLAELRFKDEVQMMEWTEHNRLSVPIHMIMTVMPKKEGMA